MSKIWNAYREFCIKQGTGEVHGITWLFYTLAPKQVKKFHFYRCDEKHYCPLHREWQTLKNKTVLTPEEAEKLEGIESHFIIHKLQWQSWQTKCESLAEWEVLAVQDFTMMIGDEERVSA